MPSLSDLWDENKYSEGDPIRQLISATKAAKEWPMDALAWGADLVDLGSSGLSKALRNQELKTDLGGNLRRAVTPPLYEGQPSFSASRAEDLEEGRSIGRMLNPLLLGGNQKLPGKGIVDKIVNKLTGASDIDKSKRTFLIGKPAEDQVSVLTDILTTPVSRREFMKDSALVSGGVAAASIPGVKLLQKFAPEEKVAEKLAATETAPKYEYNSLREYLEDMVKFAEEDHRAAELRFGPRKFDNKEQRLRDRLLEDEAVYNAASNNGKQKWTSENLGDGRLKTRHSYTTIKSDDGINYIYDTVSGKIHDPVDSYLNSFSPKAKKEMKEFKSLTKQIDTDYANRHDWTEWVIKNSKNPTKITEELKKW